jgi:hypothetical protein
MPILGLCAAVVELNPLADIIIDARQLSHRVFS